MRERGARELVEAAARHAFLVQLLEDRERGLERAVSEYQALFPGHETMIERESARLQTGWPGESPATGAAGPGPPNTGPEARARFSREALARALVRIETHGHRPDRFRTEQEVARGGQGLVLAAWDEMLQRRVAMKVALAPASTKETEPSPAASLGRFLEEAQVTARLDHPGIVPVHDLGLDHEGRIFFTMKLVRGRDLRAIYALVQAGEEGWTETRALHVLLKVCEAMAYAHSRGVVHRDLKPSNVMVGRFGEVYVMDWGLARMVAGEVPRPGVGPESAILSEPCRVQDEDPDAPFETQEGEVVGTTPYMAPEQARGERTAIGPHTDVYALGAMLYQLLTGYIPFVAPGVRPGHLAILQRVLAGAPEPVHRLAPRVPAELVAICEKAMARAVAERYEHMGELADDLRAYLEHRVVSAYETGAVAELRKWVGRNRMLAASFVAAFLLLAAGLSASLVFKARSDHNATIAFANEERAREQESLATRRLDEVLRLSALQRLDDLHIKASRFWPLDPGRVREYEEWLRDAEQLIAELPDHEARLDELRARALPWTEEEQARQRASHPRFAELERDRRHLDFHRRLAASLASNGPTADPQPAEVGLDLSGLPATAAEVNALAWPLVDPDRKECGEEGKGLLLARHAVALAADLPARERADIRDTLAWALFGAGRFEEALEEEERALAEAGADRERQFHGFLERLRETIRERTSAAGLAREAAHVAEAEAHVAELEEEVSRRRQWIFAASQDQWWHNQLERLVDDLRAFSEPDCGLGSEGVSAEHGWSMRKRYEYARSLEERSVSGPEARAQWALAIASIQDPSECPQYRGLVVGPQIGLVPLGRDPHSGLWEFAHLHTGEPAVRGPDGRIVLREETGLVLVLLPGGSFWMGAQGSDTHGVNYDPQADVDEGPVHEVALSPFFLSKYEMTQGQWQRFTGHNPSRDRFDHYDLSWNAANKPWSLLHPVEQVSWNECDRVLRRLGLTLPTEAQWEYAARGGTRSAWWPGDRKETLQGVANLADSYAQAHAASGWEDRIEAWLDDGNTSHTEVGSYRANPFGLHDIHGNVAEWCLDAFFEQAYRRSSKQDPLVDPSSFPSRVVRGGGFSSSAFHARSACRKEGTPMNAGSTLGLRPVRPLTP